MENVKTVIQITLKHLLVNLLIIALFLLIGNGLVPSVINWNNDNLRLILLLLLFYVLFKQALFARRFNKSLRQSNYVWKIRNERIDSVRHIKANISSVEISLEENKEKLNLIKAFSPIPIIVFFLSLLTNNIVSVNIDSFLSIIKLENFSFKSNDWYVLFSFCFFIYYLLQLNSTWERYREGLQFLRKLKAELIYLESEEYKIKLKGN